MSEPRPGSTSSRLRKVTVLVILSLTLAACGGAAAVLPTTTPIPTSTPRATLLPTVATSVPYGSADQPFDVVLVPPPASSETGTALSTFLNSSTGLSFKVSIATNPSDVLSALCDAPPTFAWVDGWTLLAAQAQGCGNVVLRIKQGDVTGVKSDIVISSAAGVDTIAALRQRAKTRDFCRVDWKDTISWILPVMVLRAPTFHPLNTFRNIKDYSDPNAMMQDVSDNKCVAAIPSGTLANVKLANVPDITKTVKVLATSPELPFGGLMASESVPPAVADQVAKLFPDHMDQLKNLVVADSLVPATNADFNDVQSAFAGAGIQFGALGQ